MDSVVLRKLKVARLLPGLCLLYNSRGFLWFLICFGVLLRLAQYLYNRSLWQDEAKLASNIISRSFSELVQPLDYAQAAPIGFLAVERLLVYLLGNSEYALRLFPLLCGVISVFLFYRVADQYVERRCLPVALGLFAMSNWLIYYSSEVKQYSSDVAIVLLLYFLANSIEHKELTVPRIMLFGVTGATAIWFSHPSMFVLAGLGLSLVLFCLEKRQWSRIGRLSIVYTIWLLSFAAFYFVSIAGQIQKELESFWSTSFMPFPPASLSDIQWFVRTFFDFFEKPAGLLLSGIAALAFLAGCISMLLEKKRGFVLLISPILFTLFASAIHKYPFYGRLVLFIVPIALIFIAEGVERINSKTYQNSALIGIILIILLLYHPVYSSCFHLVKPRTHEEIRPVVVYIMEHWQDGDILYIWCESWPAFGYYSVRYGLKDITYIKGEYGQDHCWSSYMNVLRDLQGSERLWILSSRIDTEHFPREEILLYYPERIGTKLRAFKADGAAAYLYDLGKSENDKRL